MKALLASIAHWMPLPYTCLGADGIGVGESRQDLRNYFEVSSQYITAAALNSLHRQQYFDEDELAKHLSQLDIQAVKLDPMQR